jgi:hypothetical protein
MVGRPHSGHISLRDDRHGAHDTRFDDDIAGTADHQQMLDIVTPDQHEAPAIINRSSVDNAKPRLAPAGRPRAEARGKQAVNQLEASSDQDEDNRKYDEEARQQDVHRLSLALRLTALRLGRPGPSRPIKQWWEIRQWFTCHTPRVWEPLWGLLALLDQGVIGFPGAALPSSRSTPAAVKCFLDMPGVFAEFETNLQRERAA